MKTRAAEAQTQQGLLETQLQEEIKGHATAKSRAAELEKILSTQTSNESTSMKTMEAKVTSATQQLEDVKTRAAEAQTTNGLLETQLQESIAKEQDFSKKGKLLVKKLKEAKEQCSKMDKECTEQKNSYLKQVDALTAFTDKQTSDIQRLTQNVADASTTQSETQKLKQSHTKLMTELTELNNRIEGAALQLKVEKEKQQELIATHINELDAVKSSLENQNVKTQQEWQERMLALQATASAAEKSAEEQRVAMRKTAFDSAQMLSKVQGENRIAQERIQRLLKTNKEKDIEHQERMHNLQRSLEEMRHRAASVNAEQGELDAIQAALESKQAALEDVKKTDRRIITDLKKEMSRVLRQNKREKEEQIIIAEKALGRLRQEVDRASQLEEVVVVLRDDLVAKAKEVDMAMLQIEQLSSLLGASGGGGGGDDVGGGGLLSWFTGATPTRSAQSGGRGMGVRNNSTPARRRLK